MASIEMNAEQCKKFVDDVFVKALGFDFDYVTQAVREKIQRDNRKGCPARNNQCRWLKLGECTHGRAELTFVGDDLIICSSYVGI